MNKPIKDKIQILRKLMKANNIDAYIVNNADPHGSEYMAPHFQARNFISGFDGSAGCVVITKTKAILWSDGRYSTQAKIQIKNTGIEFLNISTNNTPKPIEWIISELKENSVVSFDENVMNIEYLEKMQKSLTKKNISIKTNKELISLLWKDRPSFPKSKAFIHKKSFAGFSALEKINIIKKEIQKEKLNNYLITHLDDIAWLLNIRGNDIAYCTSIYSFVLIQENKTTIFIHKQKLNKKVKNHLEKNKVNIKAYDDIKKAINKVKDHILIDPKSTTKSLYEAINKDTKIIKKESIIKQIKAVHNKIELKNIKKTLKIDGLAIVRFAKYLEENIGKITELDAMNKVLEFRKMNKNFVKESFNTIAAYGKNAALMHYCSSSKTNCTIKNKGYFLLDSGGQYLGGTTDITRTFGFKNLSYEDKKDYTLSLKALINLSSLRFLKGTKAGQIDSIARSIMWNEGMNYYCGTGHGVGYFLGVHEGPQRISTDLNQSTLKDSMIITIEPGVYRENKHGIRIENIVLVKDDTKTEFGEFYKFQTLSLAPIDTSPILKELLNEKEINWLNSYHKKVYKNLKPYLKKEEKLWLRKKTKKI